MEVPTFVTVHLCPAIGVLLCNLMWLAPMSQIRHALKSENLGEMNNTPFFVTILNCIGWVIYSVLQRDFYIFFANAPGIILGFYYALESMLIGINNKNNNKNILNPQLCVQLIVGISSWWLAISLIIGLIIPNYEQVVVTMIGIICDVITISYYASPLTTVYEVIRLRDASSFSWSVTIANTSTSLLWFIYGLIGVKDPFVYIPNGIGCFLASFQLLLLLFYGQNTVDMKNDKVDSQKSSSHGEPIQIGIASPFQSPSVLINSTKSTNASEVLVSNNMKMIERVVSRDRNVNNKRTQSATKMELEEDDDKYAIRLNDLP